MERTFVRCAGCGRLVKNTDVDAAGLCCFCQPPEPSSPQPPSDLPISDDLLDDE